MADEGGCPGCRRAGGHPFDPVWRTSTVVLLACGILQDRAFDRMPILADALQDAGCEDEDILNHCRHSTGHVSACWVLALIVAPSNLPTAAPVGLPAPKPEPPPPRFRQTVQLLKDSGQILGLGVIATPIFLLLAFVILAVLVAVASLFHKPPPPPALPTFQTTRPPATNNPGGQP